MMFIGITTVLMLLTYALMTGLQTFTDNRHAQRRRTHNALRIQAEAAILLDRLNTV